MNICKKPSSHGIGCPFRPFRPLERAATLSLAPFTHKPWEESTQTRKPLAIVARAAILAHLFTAPMMRVLSALLFAAFSLTLCSCGMIKSVLPDWHVPMPKLPKLPKIGLPSLPSRNTIARFVPGMNEHDKADADDPEVPCNSRNTLGFGHTLRLEV